MKTIDIKPDRSRQAANDQDIDVPAPVAPQALRKPATARPGGQELEAVPAAGFGFSDAVNTGHIWRHGDGDISPDASALVASASSSPGNALPDELRNRFERSLGADLGRVRVHTDSPSAAAASALGARAFATEQDVYMGAGEYAPETTEGAELLAHEVAHTVQQSEGAIGPQCKLEVSEPGDRAEVEADHAAAAMTRGEPFALASGSAVARKIHRRGRPIPTNSDPQPQGDSSPEGLIDRINQVAENLKNHAGENGAEMPLVISDTIDFHRQSETGDRIRAAWEDHNFHEIPIAHTFQGRIGLFRQQYRLSGRVRFTRGDGVSVESHQGTATGSSAARHQANSSRGRERELQGGPGDQGHYRHQDSSSEGREVERTANSGISVEATMNTIRAPLIAEFDLELSVIDHFDNMWGVTSYGDGFPRWQRGVVVQCGTLTLIERTAPAQPNPGR